MNSTIVSHVEIVRANSLSLGDRIIYLDIENETYRWKKIKTQKQLDEFKQCPNGSMVFREVDSPYTVNGK